MAEITARPLRKREEDPTLTICPRMSAVGLKQRMDTRSRLRRVR